ncbi:MAG: type II secretion system protein [Planctomycetota bacterium]|nr:MAG: type II secretion system protein [Planctomycetota bacterium]
MRPEFRMPPRFSAGFTLLEMLVAIAIAGVLAAMAVPILIDSRKRGNESNAIVSMRQIHTAQTAFLQYDKDRDGQPDYATDLAELYTSGKLINEVLATGEMLGYQFALLPGPEARTWSATAVPVEPGRSGDRSFWIDEAGVIRYSTSGVAGPDDPPIGG